MLSDQELVSLSITVEYMGIVSENNLFRLLLESISSKIERSVYNRRRRKLVNHIDGIRLKLAEHFNEFEDFFTVDSMPLEVCKLSRSSRSKICKTDTFAFPDKGYCASQGSNYYGYKWHAIYRFLKASLISVLFNNNASFSEIGMSKSTLGNHSFLCFWYSGVPINRVRHPSPANNTHHNTVS